MTRFRWPVGRSRMVLRLKGKLGQSQEATGGRTIRILRPGGESLINLEEAVCFQTR